jgi:tetratricopeptide (TPR) repeat protein
MSSPSLVEPILVGREKELDLLRRRLDMACRGNGSVVFISGEAGAGKTKLVNEFLVSLKETEVTILRGCCLSKGADPYFPFISAFNNYYKNAKLNRDRGPVSLEPGNHIPQDSSQADETAGWLSSYLNLRAPIDIGGLDSQVWKDNAYAAVTKVLKSFSAAKPVAFFLEDLHWADSASLSLLHHLAGVASSQRILILATFRNDELNDDAEGRPHFLIEVLQALQREDLSTEIQLKGLDQTEIFKIFENIVGENPDFELIRNLADKSQGNPLFVVETLRMLVSSNGIYLKDGRWCLSVDSLGVPKKVKEIFLRRLNALNRAQKRTLDAASVIGEKFATDLLSAALRMNRLDLLEILQVIAQLTSLVSSEEDSFRFLHVKYREVIYEEIPKALKKEYHAQIAEIIEGNVKEGSLSDLAYHYREAGNNAKAVKYALAAGQDAVARFSNAEAIKHFTYVLQAVGEDPNLLAQRLIALEGLGDALNGSSMFNEAVRTYLELSNTAVGVVKLRALRKALVSFRYLQPTPLLEEILKKTEESAGVDRLEYARVLRIRAQISLARKYAPKVALKEAEEALPILKEESSLSDLAYLLITIGATYGSLGQNKKAIGAILQSTKLFCDSEDNRGLTEAYVIAGIFCFAGLGPEMLTMFTNAIKAGETVADLNLMAFAYSHCGLALEYMGQLSDALPLNLKAVLLAEKTDSSLNKGIAYGSLVRQYTFDGNTKLADEYFNKMVALPPEAQRSPLVGDFSKAVYFAGKDKWDDSSQYFRKCLRAKVNLGYSAWMRKSFAWALQKQGKTEKAKTYRNQAEKIVKKLEKAVDHVDVQASLMAPAKVQVGQRLDLRFDLVNVSRKEGALSKIEALIPQAFEITALPACCTVKDDSVNMQGKRISAFQVESIKLSMLASRTGTHIIKPRITYVDDFGRNRVCKPKPVRVTIAPLSPLGEQELVAALDSFEFECKDARDAFSVLISAFVEDYTNARLPQEQSGWRTLTRIAKEGHISQYSLYGSPNRRGPALSELERKGTIESRWFPGERGRGGKILKLRIAYEKENIKNYFDSNDSAIG